MHKVNAGIVAIKSVCRVELKGYVTTSQNNPLDLNGTNT